MAHRVQPGSADEVEFEQFFFKHRRLYVQIAYAILGSRASAEESVQDAMVALYVRWLRIPVATREAYARRAVVNKCLSRRRKHHRERLTDFAMADDHSVIDAWTTIGDAIEQRLTRVEVVAAMRTLTPGYRAVLTLRYLLDLPIRDVAAALAISEGGVKSQTSRALAQLRQQLAADDSRPAQSAPA
jgi:RNA polymerase sigma factor (sigma-70 family)